MIDQGVNWEIFQVAEISLMHQSQPNWLEMAGNACVSAFSNALMTPPLEDQDCGQSNFGKEMTLASFGDRRDGYLSPFIPMP